MTTTPLIFFAFANDRDAHLDLLKEESRSLFRVLEDLDRREYIKIHREESANLADLFAVFTRYPDRVAIFHYGGHAGGTLLKLEEGIGQTEGLAQLMGEQQALKLVFLNGCSTRGQVDTLFKHGVKSVIATSVEVQDRMATEFALRFYEALANKRTIVQAFHLTEAYLKSRPETQKLLSNFAGLTEWGILQDADAQTIPWGLYINPEFREEVLNWRLPYFRPVGLPQDMLQYIGKSFTANRYIVLVLDEMCKYNPDIYAQMVEQRGDETIKKDSREYPWLVIENFPWPIGSQIRLLRLYDKPNLERVEHLLSTYHNTSQVLYAILLSDLWENQRRAGNHIQWPHLSLSKAEFSQFDFFGKISELYARICQSGVPFVPECELLIEALTDAESPLAKACQYLEHLRQQVPGSPQDSNLEKLCLNAEKALSIVLRSVAFLSRYKMLTVRNVAIEKTRFTPIAYELDMGPLNATQGTGLNLYQDAAYRRKSNYSDSNSIILVSNENQLNQSLNLSPFIVDKNTYVQMKKSETTEQDKLAHVFLLGWHEDDRLFYIGVDHSVFTAMQEAKDQIHTGMTLEDFTEGRNIPEQEAEAFDADFGTDFGLDFGPETSVTETTRQLVFQVLKDQFDMLIADLNLTSHA